MSRSGYSDDCSGWELIRWRGAVASAIRGKRGQEFLREVLSVLDAMPVKQLAKETLEAEGQFCTIGTVLHSRGIAIADGEMFWGSPDEIAQLLGSTHALVAEIVYENDEYYWLKETPAERWVRMRTWVFNNIKEQT